MEPERTHSFAFSSISTDDFKFDPELASRVLAKELDGFFTKANKNSEEVEVVLVDAMWQLNHTLLPSTRGFKIAPKGSTLLLQGCQVIAVGCNKLFKSGGDRANIDMHRAFETESELTNLTRRIFPKIVPEIGKAYAVPLPGDHPLRHEPNNLRYVVHVLGPNVNPDRLDYLAESEAGLLEKELSRAYRAMFECFLNLMSKEEIEPSSSQETSLKESTSQMMSAKDGFVLPPFRAPSIKPPMLAGLSLTPYLNPQLQGSHQPFVWFRTENMVVIYDGYPKARYHLLVIPIGTRIMAVNELTSSNLPMVRIMHEIGTKIATSLQVPFRLGYHALPSLTPLHLHVISTDLNSTRLNSKKHWNSFTHPDLFVKSTKVEQQLESGSTVIIKDQETLHAAELAAPGCYQCGLRPTGTIKSMIDELKAHRCARLTGE